MAALSPIAESPNPESTGSTKSGSTALTEQNISDLLKRLEGVEKGNSDLVQTQTDLMKTQAEMKRDMKGLEEGQKDIANTLAEYQENVEHLITTTINKALQTPATTPQRHLLQTPAPTPPRLQNPHKEREYALFRNPEKRPLQTKDRSSAPPYPPTHRVNEPPQMGDITGNRPHQMEFTDLQPPPLEGLTKKLEMPIFEGYNTFAWLSKVERFFRLGRYSDEQKLDLVSMSLDGDAIGWFNSELVIDPFRDWGSFKDRLLLRFGNVLSRGPSQTLCCLKQNGPVKEYVARFEDLVSQVSLDVTTLEGIFLNGLKKSLRDVVLMMKPNSLTEMRAYAVSMESEALTRMVAREHQQEYKSCSSPNKTQFSQGWRTRDVTKEVEQPPDISLDKPAERPRMNTNNTSMAEQKRRGLCFRCNAKWSREHSKVCPKRLFQLITLVDGFECEVLESNMEVSHELDSDSDNEDTKKQSSLMSLSFNTFMGINTPTTTKLRAVISKTEVIVMIDSGATHNFISPDTIKRLNLKVSKTRDLEIRLGTGISATGTGICRRVCFDLAGTSFIDDFISLELGDADLILGIKWLSILGDMNCNWKHHRLNFKYKEKLVTLQGEHNLHKTQLAWTEGIQNYIFQTKGVEFYLHEAGNQQQAPILGMHIPNSWNNHRYMFKWVVSVTGTLCAILFVIIMSYARYQRLIGS